MLELISYIILLLTILIPIGYFLGSIIRLSFYTTEQKNGSKLAQIFSKIESIIYKICNINPSHIMSSKEYSYSVIFLNICFFIVIFILIFIAQTYWGNGNPEFKINPNLIFHIVSAYATNTDQDHANADLQLVPITKYFLLPTLMFLSSASGLSVGIMFIRAVTKGKFGNFYVDLIKSLTRILLPASFILSIIFVVLGTPNSMHTTLTYETLEKGTETLLLGPIAAIESIRIFGQNGGSILTANSSHPFCNPSYLSNFIQTVSTLLIPVALIFSLGFFLKNVKQSTVLLIALFTVFTFEASVTSFLELRGNSEINSVISSNHPNWMHKETRFGIIPSAIFSIATTNSSGATNSALESFHPISIAMMLFNLANQGIFGGQGLGPIYSLNFFIYTAIFIGFMLGKSPEIFGRRIEKNEIILSSLLLLLNPILTLLGILFTFILIPIDFSSFYNHLHYYTQVLYEFLSGAANNGSGLEQLSDNTRFFNYSLGITMILGWYISKILMIYLAGNLAGKSAKAPSSDTFKTDTILFSMIYLLISISITLLTFFPFIILGPISEVFAR